MPQYDLVATGFDLQAVSGSHFTSDFTGVGIFGFGHGFTFFNNDDFDVGWVGHVWIDTTVSSVSTTSLFDGSVDLYVFDNAAVGIETF